MCGTKHTAESFPKKCTQCNITTWINPIPTIVTIVPVCQGDKTGILLQKRNIEPSKGKWDIPGGFMDYGETWQDAASRETWEETGIKILPDHFHLLDVITTPTKYLTIVAKSDYLEDVDLSLFVPNSEVTEIKIGFDSEELAFQSHTDIFNKQLLRI